jgi:hypothetical protein
LKIRGKKKSGTKIAKNDMDRRERHERKFGSRHGQIERDALSLMQVSERVQREATKIKQKERPLKIRERGKIENKSKIERGGPERKRRGARETEKGEGKRGRGERRRDDEERREKRGQKGEEKVCMRHARQTGTTG